MDWNARGGKMTRLACLVWTALFVVLCALGVPVGYATERAIARYGPWIMAHADPITPCQIYHDASFFARSATANTASSTAHTVSTTAMMGSAWAMIQGP